MNIMQSKIAYYIKALNNHGLLNWMSDKSNICLVYWAQLGKKVNLKTPKTFNEKLQWLKLYDRRPIYCTLVDKYDVREHVKEVIGEEYLVPIYGVWNNTSEINFDDLPESFVLKCTHDSGSICICKNKANFDYIYSKKKLNRCLKMGGYSYGREWPYKSLSPRIIAEKYLIDTETNDLRDYKIHCFNGVPKVILVCSERLTNGLKEDWFTTEWKHLPIHRPTHTNAEKQIEKPEQLEKMISLSKKLAADYPFSRIDFYLVDGRIYFGEITFFPTSGYTAFVPEDYDYILGDWIQLPETEKGMD